MSTYDLGCILSAMYKKDSSSFKSQIITSSTCNCDVEAYEAFNPVRTGRWGSCNQANTNLSICFNNAKYKLTGYSFKTEGSGGGHLRSWDLYGYNDEISWNLISSHRDESSTKNDLYIANFNVKTRTFYKCFTIKGISTWRGSFPWCVMRVDFFGKKGENICNVAFSCRCKSFLALSLSFCISTLIY